MINRHIAKLLAHGGEGTTNTYRDGLNGKVVAGVVARNVNDTGDRIWGDVVVVFTDGSELCVTEEGYAGEMSLTGV